ncbi:uncharacterized protein LOC116024186 [Ipomoea triloba]|uniref:uncharacterized protein LOC116024186 n=1 Tax=Ipomoea triloba TaxID=35885 RepID=UPI00125E2307|nr:uncharacterized protein LOC116024186 [Ipomoea triloba]
MTLWKKVEEFAYKRVDGEDKSAENNNVEDESEEYQSAKEENDSVKDELENFEGSDYEIEQGQVDDQEFLKYTDPEVEYTDAGGIEGNVGESVRPNPPPELPSPLWLCKTLLCKEDFKDAVKAYAIQFRKELKFKKNDKVMCVAICTQSDCKWQATCRNDVDESFWRVIVLNDVHANCPWVNDNKFITAALVAKRWKKQIGGNSNWKMVEFRETMCTNEHHSLSIRQAYKALDFAKREIKGDLEDNFNKIWSYCLEIQQTNPKTTCLVELSDLEDGFKYRRPIIGSDSCHIKDKVRGMMLTAIGIDGNEGIFHIAYAIVEGENKDSWC